jgi:diguanylate cyclase (GGDEF)-like protein/PAS domain S-box-containing protein
MGSPLIQDSTLPGKVIDTIPTGIALLDQRGRFLHVNLAYCEIQGYAAGELIGRTYTAMIRIAEEQSFLIDVHHAVFEGLTVNPHEIRVRRPDELDIWTEVACRLIAHEEHRYCLMSVQDITERKRLEHSLQSLATTDPLTGVANRRHFLEMTKHEIARGRRTGQAPAILMIDLDNFKTINDTRGHAAGDRLLVEFAADCTQQLRESDLFGRLGGEEFGVLLPETGLQEAIRIAERLRKTLFASARAGQPACTASFGVSRATLLENSIEAAIHRADLGLYQAKRTGRNRVCAVPPEPSDQKPPEKSDPGPPG